MPATDASMDDEIEPLEVTDPELRRMLGMFDTPAFARRGQDLEHALKFLHARLRRNRAELLEMVRLRLRRTIVGFESPEAWAAAVGVPFEAIWSAVGGDEPPAWGSSCGSARRRRALARELVASIERFNRRWAGLMGEINLAPINRMIEQYNRYYVLEKECVLRSSRLAARHFAPHPPVTIDDLWTAFPALPLPTTARG